MITIREDYKRNPTKKKSYKIIIKKKNYKKRNLQRRNLKTRITNLGDQEFSWNLHFSGVYAEIAEEPTFIFNEELAAKYD